ncbi:porin [Dysgonomonas sp. 25]|uniref:porin n=1 Tax=Dysgonomonas sp. 25 TaxID=2302933 RepID=UPI0013CF8496|nr:porin [Dysgonomonas sp. 25]NDV67397.1 hypothetical protein [Dysgonomonas sp. 25]
MKKLLFILILILFTSTIYAQNDVNSGLLQKLVEKQVLTQEEADELLKESAAKPDNNKIEEAAAKVRSIFNNTPYLQIGGYGLFLHTYDNTKAVKHNTRTRVVYLHARGQLTDKLSYFFMSEFVNPMVYEYYIDWTPIKEANIRLGQFKVPYTIENPYSATALETVFNTRSVSALAGMGDDVMQYQNGINNSGRDLGVQVSGNALNDLIDYKIGLFQGAGMNTSDKDNSKNLAGTILFQPIKGLKVGGSAIWGEATYKLPHEAVEDTHVRNRWSIGGEYRSDRLYVRSEWLRGKDGKTDKEGLYGTAKYYILPTKLNLVGKVDYFNQDKESNSEVLDYLIGADYYFYTNCRIQLNYLYSDYSEKWDQKNSHQVMAQLQIVF